MWFTLNVIVFLAVGCNFIVLNSRCQYSITALVSGVRYMVTAAVALTASKFDTVYF